MHMKLNELKMRIVRDVDEDASVVAIIDKDKDNAKFLDERDLKLWYYSYREWDPNLASFQIIYENHIVPLGNFYQVLWKSFIYFIY